MNLRPEKTPERQRKKLKNPEEPAKEDIEERLVSPKRVTFEGYAQPPQQNPVLLPAPIMRISTVLGCSGVSRSSIKWTRFGTNLSKYPSDFTADSNKFLVYPASCLIVILNPVTRKQCFLQGHTAPVKCISISADGAILASAQHGKNPLVLVWDLATRKPLSTLTLENTVAVKSLDLSSDNRSLVTASTDPTNKEIISIWDLSKRMKKPPLKLKQVSNYPVNTIKFSPLDNERLVSCGRENIRFWRVSSGTLAGGAVVLNHLARTSEFLDLDFEVYTSTTKSPSTDEQLKRVFVTSDQGVLLQINYKTMEIEGAFQLHEKGIGTIKVTEGFCVTGGADNFLRVWALDFSEYILEAHHENGGIMGVDVTPDGLHVVCGTGNSAIGVLDMVSNSYTTLVRAHSAPVVALDVHPSFNWLLTASKDRTIRLWNSRTFEETHEFTCTEDSPFCLSFHPVFSSFACGFESGTMMVFEVQGTEALHSYIQHECSVYKVEHTGNGRMLASQGSDGAVCLYDVGDSYRPMKTLTVENSAGSADMCFSRDSELLAVLGAQGTVYLWDCASLKLRTKVNTSGGHRVCFGGGASELLVVQGCKVKKYNFEGKLVKEMNRLHGESDITELVVSPNKMYLLTGGTDRVLKIWDCLCPSKDNPSQSFPGHSRPISIIKFSTDFRYIYTVCEGNDGVFAWEFLGDRTLPGEKTMNPELSKDPEPSPEKPLKLPKALSEDHILKLNRVVGMNVDSRNNLVWAAELGWFIHSSGNFVIQTLLRDNNTQKLLRTPLEYIDKLAASPSFELLACAGQAQGKYVIYVYELASFSLLLELSFHEKPVESLTFSPSNSQLISAERVLVVWDSNSGKILTTSLLDSCISQLSWVSETEFVTAGSTLTHWRLNCDSLEYIELETCLEPQETYTGLAVSSNLLYAGTSRGRIELIELHSHLRQSTFEIFGSKITCLFAASDRVSVAGDSDCVISFFPSKDLGNTEELLSLDGYVTSLYMEPTGNEGLVATSAGSLWYINWTEKASVKISSSHLPQSDILAVASGPMLASASSDLTLRLWEPAGLNEVLHQVIAPLDCLCLSFEPARLLLVAGFSDGTLKFFDVNSMKMKGKSKVFGAGVRSMVWKGNTLVIGSNTGVINSIVCDDWNDMNLSVQEIGVVGGAVLSLDVLEEYLLGTSDTCKMSVWSNGRLIDVFAVLEDPHGETVDSNEETLNSTLKLYSSLSGVHTEAAFVSTEIAVCVASVFQYIYQRNFVRNEVVRRIVISEFPSTVKVAGILVVLGTVSGGILVYDQENEASELVPAHSYRVSALSVVEGGLISGAASQLMYWSIEK